MFNYKCYERRGEILGHCLDGFLFGACCNLDKSPHPDKPAPDIERPDALALLDKILGSINQSAIILGNGTLHKIDG